MVSLLTPPLLSILVITLTLRGSSAIVPACFRQGADSGRIICEDVDLTWVTAQDMTSAFQGTLGVREIILRRCDVLPDLVFLTSAATSSLKSLTLDGISLQRPLTIAPFVQFITSLEFLTLRNMIDLETVDFMRFATKRETWDLLRTFTVMNCSLQSLNPELWGFLPRVEKLNFSHNNLSLFDFGTDSFSNLVELEASYNRISLLQNLKWRLVPSLERFYMTSNKLFDAEILNKLPNKVIEIRLDGNSFSEITFDIAEGSDLRVLNLSNNHLQKMNQYFYQSNRRNIEVLEMDGNRGLNISELFQGLTKLKSLSLRFCYITKVDKQFQNLSSLEVLDLSENWIENIDQSTFIGSSRLRYLNLRSNRLSTLDFLEAAGALEMSALHSLDLTDNNLSILPSFIKAPNIRLLSIRRNSLDKLSGCDNTEALIKLESFCAPALQPDSSCEYQSFIESVQQLASKLKVYNDERCCSNPVPTNPACCMKSGTTCNIINIEILRSCPTLDKLCSPTSPTPTKAVTVGVAAPPASRKPFENLKSAEMFVVILGYMLALILLVVIIYFLYQEVSADNRRRQLKFEMRLDQSANIVSMNNGPSMDHQRIRDKRLDSGRSLGSCSFESDSNYSEVGYSTYAIPNLKSDSPNSFTFGGRQKFDDIKTSPIKPNESTNQAPKNVYTARAQQHGMRSMTMSALASHPVGDQHWPDLDG